MRISYNIIMYKHCLISEELQLSRAPSMDDSLNIDDVAASAERLDGCRPRKPSPLTIIQIKNPESNLDDVDWLGAIAIRKICILAIFGIGLCLSFVAVLSWALSYCDEGLEENNCKHAAFLLLPGKATARGSVWNKVFDEISKYSIINARTRVLRSI